MKVISSPYIMNSISRKLLGSGKDIGLVPTMGALHEGHLSLIKKARKENDIVVVSIFINPKQFSAGEDYRRYPRDIKNDRIKAEDCGCDILFHPDNSSMYGKGFATGVEVQGLSSIMCAVARPHHFKGVALVCLKLFNIVMPGRAYFGQKDYQQSVIIKKMVEDLNVNTRVNVLPTVRGPDGLAMSSRNGYLSRQERKAACLIYKSLLAAKQLIISGERRPAKIIPRIFKCLKNRRINIDYACIADPITLKDVKRVHGRVLIALAVKVGKTRLIDNILVKC
jgi:pantoate--beta-alanine ligase